MRICKLCAVRRSWRFYTESMNDAHDDLKPGSLVEVVTKKQTNGQNCYGTIIGAAPDTPDTYIVEYHPGLDNGHHAGNELRVVDKFPDVH